MRAMTLDNLVHTVNEQLQAALKALQARDVLPKEADITHIQVEQPKDETHGDFATNAALVLAKQARKNPKDIADALKTELEAHGNIEKVDIAGPGFVNIVLTNTALQNEINVITQSKSYGASGLGAGKKAIVEFVSINPTGPIHVGHGRNAVFGDSIANVLKKAGYSVYREYLLNDAGNQMYVLVTSLYARYCQEFGQDTPVPEGGYPGEYLIPIAKALKERDGDKWLNITDENALYDGLRAFAVEKCMDLIKTDMQDLHIHFDNYFSEFAMRQTTEMEDVVAELRAKGYVYEGVLPPPKGKETEDYEAVKLTLFKAKAFGLAEDQAIYNRQGNPTYFGQDIAYHKNKLNRGFDLMATVIGVDQAGAFKPLEKAIEALTGRTDAYHPVTYEMVKVMRDGQPVRMGKRLNNFVLLKDVLDEVGADVYRFSMLCYKPTTPMTFDLTKAVEKSMDNPVFYVQYAHARMASVFRQQKELNIPAAVGEVDLSFLTSPYEKAILKALARYSMVVERAAQHLEPHRLAFYAQDLAKAFHSWYNADKFLLPKDIKTTHARLALVKAAQTVLKDVLTLCGVTAPDKM